MYEYVREGEREKMSMAGSVGCVCLGVCAWHCMCVCFYTVYISTTFDCVCTKATQCDMRRQSGRGMATTRESGMEGERRGERKKESEKERAWARATSTLFVPRRLSRKIMRMDETYHVHERVMACA